jgi:glycosyltransferase involved in cell wall biosynthesis
VHVLGVDTAPRASNELLVQPSDWVLHPNPDSWDIFAEGALAKLVPTLRPNSIVLYQDPWVVPRMRRVIPDQYVVAAYCPLDGAILRDDVITGLMDFHGLAVPTAFARHEILACAKALGRGDQVPFQEIAVLPHGVDLAHFGPCGDRVKDLDRRRVDARRALFPDRPELWRGFWVMNGNRNQARKRLDLTLEGFAIFAAGQASDVRLYVHWAAERRGGVDVHRLVRALGIEDRLISSRGVGVSTERLNLIYNAADVGVNTATGEGWGLIALEHAATGAAQVVPDHSACRELWQGAAEMLPVHRRLLRAGRTSGGEVDPNDLAGALSRLYEDWNYYAAMVRRAGERARHPRLQWEAIGRGWEAWLQGIEAAHGPGLMVANPTRSTARR